ERKLLAGHGAGNCLERADFRRRKPEPLQPFRAGAQDGCGVERIEGGSKPPMYTRVFRFAPSPNGYLHLGHAYSALLNDDMARAADGRLLLRIEDIDAARCRPEYEAAILDDLRWLGIAWQPNVRRQSEHFDDYQAAVTRL